MAKSRKRRAGDAARDKKLERARDAIFDMEEPIHEIRALLWALDLMGAGMRGRGDSENGNAVAVVSECALRRLDLLKKQWDRVFRPGIGEAAA